MDDLLGGDAPAPVAMDPSPAADAGAMDAFASMAPAAPAMPMAMGGAPEPVNTAVKEWEAEMEKRLEEKAKVELDAKKVKRDAATKELNAFFDERKAGIAKTKTTNRADEKQFLKARDEALKAGANPWERVVSLIETSGPVVPKAKEGDDEAKVFVPTDTTRFKQLLINLKGNPVPN